MAPHGPTLASDSSLASLRDAVHRGDHLAARQILRGIEPSSLSEEEQAELRNLRDLITPDPAATVVAVALGVFLLILAILLFA